MSTEFIINPSKTICCEGAKADFSGWMTKPRGSNFTNVLITSISRQYGLRLCGLARGERRVGVLKA